MLKFKEKTNKLKYNSTIQILFLVSFILIAFLAGIASHFIKKSLISEMVKEKLMLTTQVSKHIEGVHLFYKMVNKDLEKDIRFIGEWIILNDQLDEKHLKLMIETFNIHEVSVIDEGGIITYSNIEEKIGLPFGKERIIAMLDSNSENIEVAKKNEEYGFYSKSGYLKNPKGGYIIVTLDVDEFIVSYNRSLQQLLEGLVYEGRVLYGVFINTELVAKAHSNVDNVGEVADNKGSRMAAIDGMTYATEFFNKEEGSQVYEIFTPVYIKDELFGAIILGSSMERVYKLIFGHNLIIIGIGILVLVLSSVFIVKLSSYKEHAIKDTLTGVYSRLFLEKWLKSSKHQNNEKADTLIVMIDIDDFKEINDSYGHMVGDMALVKLAELLQDSIRDGDFVVRYGGDEFILILKSCNKDIAKSIMNRVQERVSTINVEGSEIKIGLSYGIEVVNANKEFSDYFKMVDERMYYSKRDKK